MSIPWQVMVQKQREANGLQILSISEAHIEQLDSLALHHRDPFGRLLTAQAQVEGMTLVSVDSAFRFYDVIVVQ